MRKLFFIGLIVSLLLMGSSTAAQRPDAPVYAERGPFSVGTTELQIENGDYPLDVTLWYPALNSEGLEETVIYQVQIAQIEGRALRDGEPNVDAGPFPLIVFSHGMGGFRIQSTFYTEHLASYGFVVVAADHPGSTLFDLAGSSAAEGVLQSFALRPWEVLRQIEFVESLNAGDERFAGMVDIDNIVVTGHSFGGYTTIAAGGAQLDTAILDAACEEGQEGSLACMTGETLETMARLRGLDSVPEGLWPATTDPRIKALVPLAPAAAPLFGEHGLAAVSIPTMILVGSADDVTVPENDAYVMYEQISSPDKALVVFENAGHYVFVFECTDVAIRFGFFDRCSDDVWDMQRAHDLTNHMVTAFLLATINGNVDAAGMLEPELVDFIGVRYERN